jgi:hypothetical protein
MLHLRYDLSTHPPHPSAARAGWFVGALRGSDFSVAASMTRPDFILKNLPPQRAPATPQAIFRRAPPPAK